MSTEPIKPVSADTAPPLTLDEKRKRFAELRLKMGRSQIEVTPPAGKTGYWARVGDTRELGRLEWLGFHVVHDDPKKPAWVANGAKADGTYQVGDVILLEIDTWIYDMLQEEYQNMAESQRKNAKAVFKQDAEQAGAPVFEVARAPRG
jgi:hypothetical protein